MEMCSAAKSLALLSSLPPNVAQNILQHLSMTDVCNASQACKSLWDFTCQLSSLAFSRQHFRPHTYHQPPIVPEETLPQRTEGNFIFNRCRHSVTMFCSLQWESIPEHLSLTKKFLARLSHVLQIYRLSMHFPSASVHTAELGRVLLSQLADIVATCTATLHHLSLSMFKPADRYDPIPPSSANEYHRLLVRVVRVVSAVSLRGSEQCIYHTDGQWQC